MLYDTWLEVAGTRARDIALWDHNSGERWSFDALLKAAESQRVESRCWVYPQGHSAEFILAVLRAWRAGALVCPLEPEQQPPRLPPPPSSCFHLKMTSATSGQARVIAFTPEQLAADARNICDTMGLRPDWPNLGAISLAHSYGFSNLVLPLLLHGIPLILARSPLPEMLRAAGAGHSHLTLAGVPALWRAWLEADAIPSSVRLAISAGAPLGIELERSVYKAGGLKIHNFYGSSECGGIAYDGNSNPRDRDECVGQAMQNVSTTVNQDGCLEVRGAAVGETYWPTPETGLGAGVFRTSDLAEIREGSVFLMGRAGDVINVAGRKVLPVVIERALREHRNVEECLVFGVPAGDPHRGELIVACVETTDAEADHGLKAFLLGKLPAWQVPREWWFVDSLRSNNRGKLSRADWRRRFLEGQAGKGSRLPEDTPKQ